MAHLVFNYQVSIDAKPEDVYSYVADLTRHGEWSDNLKIESASDGDVAVGSEYLSTGHMMGKDFENRLRITEYEPPTRFSFTANDGKNDVLQEITVDANGSGTLLNRRVSFEINPVMVPIFKVLIGPLVANRSMNKSLGKLKANMEQSTS